MLPPAERSRARVPSGDTPPPCRLPTPLCLSVCLCVRACTQGTLNLVDIGVRTAQALLNDDLVGDAPVAPIDAAAALMPEGKHGATWRGAQAAWGRFWQQQGGLGGEVWLALHWRWRRQGLGHADGRCVRRREGRGGGGRLVDSLPALCVYVRALGCVCSACGVACLSHLRCRRCTCHARTRPTPPHPTACACVRARSGGG